ncbi:MAG: UDP-N-acetylmuramoyl-L-alanyl-D-glutamate--2,6-diaminopimelate ligase [Clostridia bacterium]|nr:UDP-N-acetylmuramoyl-L-alanyl-D-glutamate--2,6-diaminopimelate ligase [Clostridia bacterium]
MRLSKLLESVIVEKVVCDGDWEREIAAISTDSRNTTQNRLFICLSGGNTDAHGYIDEAVKNGAVAVVVERITSASVPQILVSDTREAYAKLSGAFYGEPAKALKIIGITGTNGKTTTSYMLASILQAAKKNVGVIGTLGVSYAGQTLAADLTTPDPDSLHRIFADMLQSGVEYVVMEVSAHALYYQKLAGVTFAACIFTNFTQDHLDFFPSMQAYKAAKARLFKAEICPVAILNGDDEAGREFGKARAMDSVTTRYYGLLTPSDAFAIVTDESLYGSECMLNINDKLCRVSLALTGRHNVYNALAAALCAKELGVAPDVIADGLNALKGVDGRLERIGKANVYVDFAHTPDGLEKSLDALRAHCKGRLICLFGCGGNRDKAKRPLMGETAAKKADFSILTSDNPRYEDPLDIISDVEKGYRRFSVRYVIVPDRKKAIVYALECLGEKDVLLVAGKGGEESQEIMGIKYAFNDNAIIEKWLEEKGRVRE